MRLSFERILQSMSDRPFAVAAGLTVLILAPFLPGPFGYILNVDSSDQTLPFFALGARDVFSGHYWHPYIQLGLDALAIDIFNVVDGLLNALLPPWLAYQVSLLGANLLGVWATVRLCQRLGISSAGAVAGALALVAMNSIGHTNHNALPLLQVVILWLGHPRFTRLSAASIGLAALIGLLYAASTSAIFPIPFGLCVIVGWFIVVEPRGPQFWVSAAVVEALIVALKLPIISDMTAYANLSNRLLTPYRTLGLDGFADAARFGASKLAFFFFGQAGYWFAYAILVVGVAAERFRLSRPVSRILLFLLLTAAAMFLAYLVRPYIPDRLAGLRTFSINRIGLAVLPVLAIGIAGGVDAIGRILEPLVRRPDAGVGSSGLPTQLASALALVGILGTAGLPALRSELYGWLYVGTYVRLFHSPVLKSLAQEAAGQQVRGVSFAMPPAWLATYGIETVDGNGPMHTARYHRYWSTLLEPGKVNPDPRIAAAARIFDEGQGDRPSIEKGDRPEDLVNGVRLSTYVYMDMLELLNVRYVASLVPLLDPGLRLISGPATNYFTLSQTQKLAQVLSEDISGRRNVYTYEMPAFAPRFFLAPAVEVVSTTDDVLARLRQRPLAELLRTAIAEAEDHPAVDPAKIGFTTGNASVSLYSPDRIVVKSTSDGPGVLVAVMNYDRSWHALVDGNPVPTFPVYHTMIGLTVPSGAHQVELVFDPPYRPSKILARITGNDR